MPLLFERVSLFITGKEIALFTGVDFGGSNTGVTLHAAAPAKLAAATLFNRNTLGVVTASATQQRATVDAWRCPVALAACCAERSLQMIILR